MKLKLKLKEYCKDENNLLSLLICHAFCGSWGTFAADEIRPDRDQDADVGHADEDHRDEPGQDHEDPDVGARESVAREAIKGATDQVCLYNRK